MECYIEEGSAFVAFKWELKNAFTCWWKSAIERGVEDKKQKTQLTELGPKRDRKNILYSDLAL